MTFELKKVFVIPKISKLSNNEITVLQSNCVLMKFEMKTTLTTISKDAIYHVSGTNQRQYSDKKNTVLKNTYYDSITDINRFVESQNHCHSASGGQKKVQAK